LLHGKESQDSGLGSLTLVEVREKLGVRQFLKLFDQGAHHCQKVHYYVRGTPKQASISTPKDYEVFLSHLSRLEEHRSWGAAHLKPWYEAGSAPTSPANSTPAGRICVLPVVCSLQP
jgi:hypothetical protein